METVADLTVLVNTLTVAYVAMSSEVLSPIQTAKDQVDYRVSLTSHVTVPLICEIYYLFMGSVAIPTLKASQKPLHSARWHYLLLAVCQMGSPPSLYKTTFPSSWTTRVVDWLPLPPAVSVCQMACPVPELSLWKIVSHYPAPEHMLNDLLND